MPPRRINLGFTRPLLVRYNRSMKHTPAITGCEAEQAESANSAVFHRPGEALSYSRFTCDLQLWRGEKLRLYYEALENPTYRRRSTKPGSVPDLLERLREALSK